ncbi:2,3-bisphosphoglycerate-independent phosphoglycerate mutase [Octadecabacter ascidiaceicola]|uniref:2,3-bisphosphoglycerate-independent phosphoglycerate mutase n=1 Tax=Octadecabacter ascidiaceicola TaxID=1655543 RepID=A0A238KB72_9RHOB|nr:2,3-bisphosphoglycerate-independent phosphoglycerate mutase [Octadecabacter ascidiaceicola]SMX40098.1 2,3-bisphosphoglycerate-independent phosphoglycerate mutase [Octadecabacter ascidiaceicola]
MSAPKPVVLCILDGWGNSAATVGNAPALADTPNYDRIMSGPTAELITHGPDVGLPRGQMGNSEVGHTNIGAGRVVAMDLGAIDLAIEDQTFAQEPALKDFVTTVKAAGGRAHIAGLISDGGVHSHINHMIAAAQALCDAGLEVVIHAITDGRDVAPKSALIYLKELREHLPDRAWIGSVIGRYYAMDRDNRWERVQDAFYAMMYGDAGDLRFDTAESAIEAAYADDLTDEFIKPSVIGANSAIYDDDGLFFLNFRADRAREILSALADPDFDAFDTHGADHDRSDLAAVLGMVDYSDHHTTFMTTVFPKKKIKNTLGAWVAAKGLRQFRVAETEKYPHVTFFLNGGIEMPETGEDRYMAPSPKVATYDLQPEMSAAEVTDAFVGAIKDGYDLIVCNYANPDMVGHTGDINAAVKACEAVDAGLGRVLAALETVGGAMIVTADHGNCETMVDPETGGPHTAHTTNPVPVALVGGPEGAELNNGRLADLAPTLLDLMGLGLPPEMTGVSLIK